MSHDPMNINFLYGNKTNFDQIEDDNKKIGAFYLANIPETSLDEFGTITTSNIKSYLYFCDEDAKFLNIVPELLSVSNGGTGRTTLEKGKALVGNDGNEVELREIIESISTTGPIRNSNSLITENALGWWDGSFLIEDSTYSYNLSKLGTVDIGTWKANIIDTAYGGTGNNSYTENRIIYSFLPDPTTDENGETINFPVKLISSNHFIDDNRVIFYYNEEQDDERKAYLANSSIGFKVDNAVEFFTSTDEDKNYNIKFQFLDNQFILQGEKPNDGTDEKAPLIVFSERVQAQDNHLFNANLKWFYNDSDSYGFPVLSLTPEESGQEIAFLTPEIETDVITYYNKTDERFEAIQFYNSKNNKANIKIGGQGKIFICSGESKNFDLELTDDEKLENNLYIASQNDIKLYPNKTSESDVENYLSIKLIDNEDNDFYTLTPDKNEIWHLGTEENNWNILHALNLKSNNILNITSQNDIKLHSNKTSESDVENYLSIKLVDNDFYTLTPDKDGVWHFGTEENNWNTLHALNLKSNNILNIIANDKTVSGTTTSGHINITAGTTGNINISSGVNEGNINITSVKSGNITIKAADVNNSIILDSTKTKVYGDLYLHESIYYNNDKTNPMKVISFKAGNENGASVFVRGKGQIVIAAGESIEQFEDAISGGGSNESIYLAADDKISFYTGSSESQNNTMELDANGNLTLLKGDATISNGNLTLSGIDGEGSIIITKGNLTLTAGNATLTKGSLTLKEGNATLTKGNLTLTAGNATLTKGSLTLKEGNAALEKGSLNVTGGDIKILTNAKGYYLTDPKGKSYAAVRHNGTNLWIGAEKTESYHHVGETYISTGHNGATDSTAGGYDTIKVTIPNANNNNGTSYKVFHSGMSLIPAKNNAKDLGSSSNRWKDAYFSGTVDIKGNSTGVTVGNSAYRITLLMGSGGTNTGLYHETLNTDGSVKSKDWAYMVDTDRNSNVMGKLFVSKGGTYLGGQLNINYTNESNTGLGFALSPGFKYTKTKTCALGTVNKPWSILHVGEVWITTAGYINDKTIATVSDKRLKEIVEDKILQTNLQVYDSLTPTCYKYKKLNSEDTYNNTHIGFFAQDIEKIIRDKGLTNEDCSLVAIRELPKEGCEEVKKFCTDGQQYFINYNELHGLHTLKNHQQDQKLLELENKNKELEEKIDLLQKQIKNLTK